MSFNTPITVCGDVSMDGITQPSATGNVELRSVLDLAQIRIELNTDDDLSWVRCDQCGLDLNEADPTVTQDDGAAECSANDDGPHEPVLSPLTWAKNVSVSFDEDKDEIELAIATGEPRGGWTFTLQRGPNGKVRMSLPHADMSAPHEPIREIHPGTFEIG